MNSNTIINHSSSINFTNIIFIWQAKLIIKQSQSENKKNNNNLKKKKPFEVMNPFHQTHSLVILSKEYYSFLQPNIYTWHIGLLDGSAWKATHFIFIALVTVKRPARVFPRLGRLQEESDSMVSRGFERHHMVGSLIETKSCFQQPFSWSMSSANFVSGGRFISGYSCENHDPRVKWASKCDPTEEWSSL